MTGGSDLNRALSLFAALNLGPVSEQMQMITIPGAPWSKSRPRFNRNGRTYADKDDVDAERRTGLFLRSAVKAPYTGNVAIGCIFFRPNRQRIDTDNLLKHICDAGNGIIYHDDSQVTAILGMVELDQAKPRTVVMIGRHASTLTRGSDATYPCAFCLSPISLVGAAGKHPKTCSPTCATQLKGYRSLAVPVSCAQCQQPFRRSTATRRFCSQECAKASMRGKPRGSGKNLSRCSGCDAELSHYRGGMCRECWRTSATTRYADRG